MKTMTGLIAFLCALTAVSCYGAQTNTETMVGVPNIKLVLVTSEKSYDDMPGDVGAKMEKEINSGRCNVVGIETAYNFGDRLEAGAIACAKGTGNGNKLRVAFIFGESRIAIKRLNEVNLKLEQIQKNASYKIIKIKRRTNSSNETLSAEVYYYELPPQLR
ncbi:MAG: hypothetical protein Q7K44_02320 [Candidatus Liptonbacteria bacterium]|nr:hypothetical protein [Candidatus Liptonbacteria bacterium]